MNRKQINEFLAESIAIERELYEFCIDCLKAMYPEQQPFAIHLFEESINHFGDYGCIQSLDCINKAVKHNKQFREELEKEEPHDGKAE